MPDKVVETQFPLIDADPHASRVISYFRPSDYAVWAASTAAFPGLLYAWEMADPTNAKIKTPIRLGGFLGFSAGFLFAYQRSSTRFWGWSENKREEEMDLKELRERAEKGLPLYGSSHQPDWVQAGAARNSQWSQLKFATFPMVNLVSHQHHGTDPAKYGVKSDDS
ncbi:NADH-ubiquinone oxidoreductase complex I, 21 kDa subunit-domain-containing protein [Crepidotus variabilis]|uniref:NADH-ubiquinone oxidoreductase complex I, 21 kDa subunit-domain-containing protein n=1 Tax=Crepidotus variabilis TaxID=179855 RepID=A0A9P6JTM8_9AGAR|nr:NADH-ubiquinone oxidoreductase complex I, 21 kDa subunit-domain-containing protein [Crepidotus variabilis]